MKTRTLLFGMIPLLALIFVLAGCTTGEALKIIKNCSDSDGISYYTKGIVKVGAVSYPDICIGPVILKEGYCSGTQYKWLNYTCPNGCVAGKCVRQTSNQTGSNQTR
ncbi:MAG: hypothetical protein Q7J54_07930 [Candidatus Woesearchaeota archaeon]|nr:hypothetical protein [Candidatus Woesearchaeota archaeon]